MQKISSKKEKKNKEKLAEALKANMQRRKEQSKKS